MSWILSIPSPSTPGGIFSSPAAPNAGGTSSLFGVPNSTVGVSGAVNSNVNSVLEAPQQAAIQAHMNDTLHQEASRLESKLSDYYSAYAAAPTLLLHMCRIDTVMPLLYYIDSIQNSEYVRFL